MLGDGAPHGAVCASGMRVSTCNFVVANLGGVAVFWRCGPAVRQRSAVLLRRGPEPDLCVAEPRRMAAFACDFAP